jgi:transcriptional regulator with GAF, ATPase, and Fis domain
MEANTDSRSDLRFDPNFAAQILSEMANERSLEQLLKKLRDRAMERSHFACVQIWLIEKGDRCATCPKRPECPDQSRCLHLAVAAGKSMLEGGKGFGGLDLETAREPLGVPPIGSVVASGQHRAVPDLNQLPVSPLDPDWMREEGIRGYAINPISYQGEALGAIVSATREPFIEELRPWGFVFADRLGAAIANARAFEEIQRLKEQLEEQNAYLQEEVVEAKAFGELVGQSSALRHLVGQIDLVASTEASVLISGDTGTGKELVAHEIHHRSRRKDKPLVRVNCASIPKDLFESEFFGHARGAFTGAIKDRAGRFETAEGGTIFLDEIGEVPLELQSKLLRVLQEKRYERVGEDRTRVADVRIIGATNRDLKKEAAAGRFREDLYYRLNVFPIQVMPLRERVEDIPPLASHFIELSVKELRCPPPRLTRAGVVKLQSYDWPGNVRELRNVIERAVIVSRGGVLDFDLPVTHALPTALRGTPADTDATEPEIWTELEMRRRERDNHLAALQKTNWKITGPDGAAELLGIKPTTLVTRMQKMGLKRPEDQIVPRRAGRTAQDPESQAQS